MVTKQPKKNPTTLTKKQKDQIKMWVKEAQTVMHLQDSVITIKYKPYSPNQDRWADTLILPKYISGDITIYEEDFAELWSQFEGDGCKQIIFHEVAHILIGPLSELNEIRFLSEEQGDTEKEQLAEKLSHIILELIGD